MNWQPAASADPTHDDVEADLAGTCCGDAQWAWVADNGGDVQPWSWTIYRRWLWEDIDADPAAATLAEGRTWTKVAAQNAVETWLRSTR